MVKKTSTSLDNPIQTVTSNIKKAKLKKGNKIKKTKTTRSADQTTMKKEGIHSLTGPLSKSFEDKYPVLKDEALVNKFLGVPMNNNQKGRVRQILKDKLKGTSDALLPDVIYEWIQVILKSSENLTDTELRKIRILYNMLKTAVSSNKKEKKEIKEVNEEQKKSLDKVKKVKGKKRYVVFVGNLPLDVDKEKIMQHFSDLSRHIVDVRIPKRTEEKKSAIAYVELDNEPTFELALSKHHSMFANKRINVLYTMQKKGKMTKSEAKSKTAKLTALQKTGRLIGSVPLNRKRSQRRLKQKQAMAKEEQKQNA